MMDRDSVGQAALPAERPELSGEVRNFQSVTSIVPLRFDDGVSPKEIPGGKAMPVLPP